MPENTAQSQELVLDGFVIPAGAGQQPPGLLFDLTAVGNWLEPFRRKSPHTHRAYQRIAAYWLYFLEQTHGYHADLLLRAGPIDAHDFLRALTHEPQDAERSRNSALLASGSGQFELARLAPAPFWQDHGPRALPNHFGVASNPFARAKSPRSVAQAIASLSSLYKFNNTKRSAQDQALLDFNPFSDLGRFIVKQDAKTDRVFEPNAYLRMLSATDRLLAQAETQTQQQRAIRLRWITVALFNLWMRISELSSLRMSDIRQRGGVWFASVHGKGRKVRAIEITPAVMQELEWKTSCGCAKCRPALNYYLVSDWPDEYADDYQSRYINERVHANIQKDGTYSVVPRMWGGVTNAAELRAIADVVDKFEIPMVKVTGGQRIDLLGIEKEDLPAVWADLGKAGFVSGHAYAKGLRTVKKDARQKPAPVKTYAQPKMRERCSVRYIRSHGVNRSGCRCTSSASRSSPTQSVAITSAGSGASRKSAPALAGGV